MENKVASVDYSVPQSLRKTLKNGEYAVYQLVDVYYDKEGKLHGRTAGIPNRDVVMLNGEPKSIGYVEGYNPDGSQRLGNIWFHIDTECTVLCLHGAKNANLYAYLEASNFNESNPNRDPSVPAVYRRVDSLNHAKQTREQRSLINRMISTAMAMSDQEIIDFIENNKNVVPVRIVGLPDGKYDYEAIRDGFERWIEKNAGVFEKLTSTQLGDSDESIKGMIAKAREGNIIGFDRDTKSWFGPDGKPFLKVTTTQFGGHISQLVAWLKSEQGAKILAKIQGS